MRHRKQKDSIKLKMFWLPKTLIYPFSSGPQQVISPPISLSTQQLGAEARQGRKSCCLSTSHQAKHAKDRGRAVQVWDLTARRKWSGLRHTTGEQNIK